jgi:hypothetical protein
MEEKEGLLEQVVRCRRLSLNDADTVERLSALPEST